MLKAYGCGCGVVVGVGALGDGKGIGVCVDAGASQIDRGHSPVRVPNMPILF